MPEYPLPPENLSGHGRSLTVQCIQDSEFQSIHSKAIGQFVVELFLGNSRLWNTEAAKCARRHQVCVHRACERPIIRNVIRTRPVHRDSSRYRGSPRGVGPGIEVRREVERDKLALSQIAPPATACAPDVASLSNIDSVREKTIRTGFASCHAATAKKGCTERSSFDPNAPPTAVGMIRTFLARLRESQRYRSDPCRETACRPESRRHRRRAVRIPPQARCTRAPRNRFRIHIPRRYRRPPTLSRRRREPLVLARGHSRRDAHESGSLRPRVPHRSSRAAGTPPMHRKSASSSDSTPPIRQPLLRPLLLGTALRFRKHRLIGVLGITP